MPAPGDLLRVLPAAAEPPARAAFEAIVTRYLTTAVPVRLVETIRSGLEDAGLLDAAALGAADPGEIAEAGTGSGDHRRLTWVAPLRRLAAWWTSRGATVDRADDSSLFEELGALRGIGPATAHAILLFGLGRAVFPVSRPTYRVLLRHGWVDPGADYEEASEAGRQLGGGQTEPLRRLAAGLESIGTEFCRAAAPRCDRCPLKPWLPESGPHSPL